MVVQNGQVQTREHHTFRALLFQLASTHEREVVALRAESSRLRGQLAQLERRFGRPQSASRLDRVGQSADVIDIDNQPLLARGCLDEVDHFPNDMEIDLDVHVPPEALEAFITEADAEAIDAFMNEIYEEDKGRYARANPSYHSTTSAKASTKSSSRTVQIHTSWIQQPTLDAGVHSGEATGEDLKGCMSASTSYRSGNSQRFSGREERFSGKEERFSEAGTLSRNEPWCSEPPNLDPVLKRWRRIVELLQQFASKELFQLSPIWQKNETFLAKARRTCNQIDLFGSAHQARRNGNAEGGFLGALARASRVTMSSVPRGSTSHSPSSSLQDGSHSSIVHATTGQTVNLGSRPSGYFGFQNFSEFERFIVINPASTKRLTWAVLGLLLMLYDLVMVPMEAFELPDDPGLKVCAWFAQLYWSFDIILSFITGIYANGEMEMRLKKIAKSYILHWFTIDIIITLPLWFVLVLDLDSSAESARSLKSARYIRMLRFLRLARLAKFEHLLNEALEIVNSTSILLGFGIVKLMVIMVIYNHLVACAWYWVGSFTTDDHTGWAKDPKYEDRHIVYQYMSSLHWTLTQFQGTSEITPGSTTLERVYAVTTVLFALIGLASFVSSLTNMMMQLESLQSKRTREQRVVRGYLAAHNVSYRLSLRVKAYLAWRQRAQKGREYDDEVANMLPAQLMMDLHDEVRSPFLCHHTFFETFREVYPRTIRIMCSQAVSSVLPSPNELIFSTSDASTRMYFLMNGTLAYRPVITRLLRRSGRREQERHNSPPPRGSTTSEVDDDPDELVDQIRKGDFLSEQSLWTTWEHVGELTVTNKDASMLTVEREKFVECIKTNPLGIASAILYARRYLAGLNRFGKSYTDYISMDEHISMMKAADEGAESDSEDDNDGILNSQDSAYLDSGNFTTEPIAIVKQSDRSSEGVKEPAAAIGWTGFWPTGPASDAKKSSE